MEQKSVQEEIFLITGAAGSIGRELSLGLAKRNPKQLILIDLGETALHSLLLELREIAPQTSVVYFIDSICNEALISYVFGEFKPTTVIHAAAYKHVSMAETNVCATINTNVYGAKLVLDTGIEHQLSRFIFISTDKAVSPQSVMGQTKKLFEDYALSRQQENIDMQIHILRLCNVYGSSGSVVPLFAERISKLQPLVIRGKGARRAFVQPDCLMPMLEALLGDTAPGIYIPHDYELLSVPQIATRVLESFDLNLENYPITYKPLFASEKEHEELKAFTEIESPEPNGPLILVTNTKKVTLDLSVLQECIHFAQNYEVAEAHRLLTALTLG